ncbi:MAG: penicillin-binding protein activator LpoB [Spirochaetaceae bacterium]|nr:penicillin-binding protein activator LpoB [Spirochaetaceae bacterium]
MNKKEYTVLLAVLFFAGRAAGVHADSEIIIRRAASNVNAGFKERIYIDGRERLTLANGTSGSVRIPDGEHTIHAELYTLKTSPVRFSASSGTVKFHITPYSLQNFVIEKVDGGTDAAPARAAASSATSRLNSAAPAGGIEGAITNVCDTLIADLPRRSTVAVLSVSSRDRELATFTVDEIEFQLVDSKQFDMVDRKTLDSIRDEQNFQMSGDVSDSSAVSIGNMLGASVVITGSITGSGSRQRLTVKALDVKTAKIVTMAREQF